MKKQQINKGFSLIEFLIVSGIIAVGTIATISLSSTSEKKALGLQLIEQTTAIKSVINDIYPNGDYTGLTNNTLILTGSLPNDMVSGVSIVHAGSGLITVAPVTPFVGDINKAYSISFGNLEPSQCNALANNMANIFMRINVNGVAVKTEVLAIDPAAVSARCNVPASVVQLIGI